MQLYYRRVDALNLITREHLMNLVLVIRDKEEEKRRLKMVSFNRINTTRSLTIYYYLEFGPWADAVRSSDPRHKTSGTHRSPYDELVTAAREKEDSKKNLRSQSRARETDARSTFQNFLQNYAREIYIFLILEFDSNYRLRSFLFCP